jgi:biopolymer transport protein ExbD
MEKVTYYDSCFHDEFIDMILILLSIFIIFLLFTVKSTNVWSWAEGVISKASLNAQFYCTVTENL